MSRPMSVLLIATWLAMPGRVWAQEEELTPEKIAAMSTVTMKPRIMKKKTSETAMARTRMKTRWNFSRSPRLEIMTMDVLLRRDLF